MTYAQVDVVARKDLGQVLTQYDLSNTLMVDTYNGSPFNMKLYSCLNPFYTWPKPCIPVFGLDGIYASSVESIWQGMKWIEGKIDREQFEAAPYKRPTEEQRNTDPTFSYADILYQYHDEKINQRAARFLIYLPAYLFLLEKLVALDLLMTFKKHLNQGKNILFYDWDSNFAIDNITESFSHSFILASWFRGRLAEDFLVKAEQVLPKNYYNIFYDQFSEYTDRYRKFTLVGKSKPSF